MENRDMEKINREGSRKTFWFFFKKTLGWAFYYIKEATVVNFVIIPIYGYFKFDPTMYWHDVLLLFAGLELTCLLVTLLFLLGSLIVCLFLAKKYKHIQVI